MEKEKLPKVLMVANLNLFVREKNGVIKPFDHSTVDGQITFGGFGAILDGKEINFDWNASGYSIEKHNTYIFESGYGPFFNDFELADYYDEELKKCGLSRHDLTAEKLSKISELTE